MNELVSMGAVFALGFIGIAVALLAYMVAAAIFVLVALLGSGVVIKCVNIKLGWRSFKIYSNVLLITGAFFTIVNIIYIVCIFQFFVV